jgi:hypothetical protein
MRSRRVLFTLALLGLSCASTPVASAATSIDTTGAWNGHTFVSPFGCPDTATFGQTITAPFGDTVLDSFSFYMQGFGGRDGDTLVFRGEVYTWDGSRAIGPNVWEGAPGTLTLTSTAQQVAFNTGGVQLVAGRQYVLFASISKDYEQNAPGNFSDWAFLGEGPTPNPYAGGRFVYLSDTGDESLWTNPLVSWGNFGDADGVFKAAFSGGLPTTRDECKNGGWQTFGVFKNQGDCVSFVASNGKNLPAGTKNP